MDGIYCDRRRRAERLGQPERAALNQALAEACDEDRRSLNIYNPSSVERVIKKYEPLLRVAHASYDDELREEEETLSAIAKLITSKLEAASQSVRESGEAVEKLVADLAQRKREEVARANKI